MVSVSTHKRPMIVREPAVIRIALGPVTVEAGVVYMAVDNGAETCDFGLVRRSSQRHHFLLVPAVAVPTPVAEFDVVVCADVH